ncbi:hypothetical protein [Mycobacterium asiaticum]|uniref:Uncharacterized protein n=1 Tax=Mycobacterium asiaticum TaxID=1790 RepID=A0A1A3DFS4_MYCAS|nr:hypothetical protein [Mycobacterium asiaticum]OBI72914.1 hypothetical protein A9X01_06930 [Mycobacterium asiaticum]OBI97775.1 hypothetical protein A5661_17110 [Mycobacterium asiaticum]ORA14709.1 hypothetical protein BST16_10710 [Mycobacterium asiaticum DSM 44297]
MADDAPVSPELIDLTDACRQRVSDQINAKGGYCESCAGTEFTIGRALPLGFLFLNEDHDAYLVALSCRTPGCPKPRTAIALHHDEIFTLAGQGAADS